MMGSTKHTGLCVGGLLRPFIRLMTLGEGSSLQSSQFFFSGGPWEPFLEQLIPGGSAVGKALGEILALQF